MTTSTSLLHAFTLLCIKRSLLSRVLGFALVVLNSPPEQKRLPRTARLLAGNMFALAARPRRLAQERCCRLWLNNVTQNRLNTEDD